MEEGSREAEEEEQLEGSSNCQRTFVAVVIAFFGLCLSAMVVVVASSPEEGVPSGQYSG